MRPTHPNEKIGGLPWYSFSHPSFKSAIPTHCSFLLASAIISRYRDSKIWRGKKISGKNTTLGSGKTGMTSGMANVVERGEAS